LGPFNIGFLSAMAEEKKTSSLLKQLLCAFVINLVSLLQGASVSSSSIILHELENSTSHNHDSHCHRGTNCTSSGSVDLGPFFVFDDFHITQEEGSWIASSWVLGHFLSACFAGFVSDVIGRKKSLLLDTAVFCVGFIILATGHLSTCLIIARLLLGYPLVSQVFLCEILDESRRGLGAAMYSVLHSIGFFLVLFTGAFLPWRLAIFIPVIISIPTFIFILFLHESPAWLRQKGRIEEYQKSMEFYKKCENSQTCKIQNPTIEDKKKKSILNNLKLISTSFTAQDKSFWSTFLLLCTLFACVGWCGFSILSFYATEIFTKSGSPFSASHTSWITSLTKIICSIGSFYVLHRFNRRYLFLFTSLLIFLSFASMSMYTMLDYVKVFSEDVTEKINFIPMTCVIMAYVGYGLGYGVIPSLIAAETMPVDVRSTAVGFFMMIEMLSSFLLSKMKPLLMDSLHMHGLFAMFSSTVLMVIILMLKFKPRAIQAL